MFRYCDKKLNVNCFLGVCGLIEVYGDDIRVVFFIDFVLFYWCLSF